LILKQRKLLTVVAEAAIEHRLIKDIERLGAKGFTVSPAHGKGPRNQRTGDLEGGNIRLETVVSNDVLEGILEILETNYFPHYACSAWVSQVEVVRDERY
jgi:nitrogen regulatory protein P-II 2